MPRKLHFSAKRSVTEKFKNVVFHAKQFLHQDSSSLLIPGTFTTSPSLYCIQSFLLSFRPSVCMHETTGKPLQEILSCEAFTILVEALQFYLKFATTKRVLYTQIFVHFCEYIARDLWDTDQSKNICNGNCQIKTEHIFITEYSFSHKSFAFKIIKQVSRCAYLILFVYSALINVIPNKCQDYSSITKKNFFFAHRQRKLSLWLSIRNWTTLVAVYIVVAAELTCRRAKS